MKPVSLSIALVAVAGVLAVSDCSTSGKTAAAPPQKLQLTASLHDMISNGSFATFSDDKLYAHGAAEEAGWFTVAGTDPAGGSCDASVDILPGHGGGQLKKTDLDTGYGYVVALVTVRPGCTPSGFYGVIGAGSSAAIVARAKTGTPGQYEGKLVPFGSTKDTLRMTFEFCGHPPGQSVDRARRYQYDPSTQKPCDVAYAARHAAGDTVSKGGNDSSEPDDFVPNLPIQDEYEIAWGGCSGDCCPASQPPDTSFTGIGRSKDSSRTGAQMKPESTANKAPKAPARKPGPGRGE